VVSGFVKTGTNNENVWEHGNKLCVCHVGFFGTKASFIASLIASLIC